MIMRITFLEKIAKSKKSMWVVSRNDEFILIGIPLAFPERPFDVMEMKVKEVERLLRMPIEANIFLTGKYIPFQYGITFYEIHDGFPVEDDIWEFIEKARKSDIDDLDEFFRLYNLENE